MRNICNFLKYTRSRKIVRQSIKDEDIKYLKDLVKNYSIYSNAQPNNLFINSYGLFTLLSKNNNDILKNNNDI